MSDEDRAIRRLTFASFQADAKPTGRVSKNPLWPALALGGEAGELLNVRKKIERDEPDRKRLELGPIPQLDQDFLEEAGDTLFYLRLALLERGFTLEDAAFNCLDKLWQKHLDQLSEGATVRVTSNANQEILGGNSLGKVGRVEIPPHDEDGDQVVMVEIDGKCCRFYAGELEPHDGD